ncbi:MAG: hypothetical protein PVG44_07565 [Desulfobacterales bacterium]
MRKIITFVLFMSVSLIPQPLGAQNNPLKFTDIVPQLENILMNLSSHINIMYKQIRINYTILPPNFFEAPLVRKERLAIQSTTDRLHHMLELLKSVNRK